MLQENAVELTVAATPVSVGLDPVTKAASGAVLKWVGEKIAGGIVGAAAGKAFNAAMEAIFGGGGPDLAGKLDDISNQITEVQRSLDRLTAMTAEILQKLDLLRDFMEKSVKVEALLNATRTIDSIYGNSGEAMLQDAAEVKPISLRLLLEKMPHFKDMTPKKLQEAARHFVTYAADVPKAIDTIRDELSASDFGTHSLLQLWAKELGQQVRDKKIARVDACLVLEAYFLQAVSTQLKGVCVHCTALSVDTEMGAEFVKEFLQDEFAGTMRKQTKAYVHAMEYLIFSSLDPIALTGRKTTMDEREFPYHVDEMLLRTDLTAAALNLVGFTGGPDGKRALSRQAAIQGIYGRALIRPSDIVNGAAPAIALPGYGTATGSEPNELPYAALDLIVKDGKAFLCDVSKTSAHLSRYKWNFAYGPPAAGTVIDSKQRLGVTVKAFPVFGPDEPLVLAASVLDASHITMGLPASSRPDYIYAPFIEGGRTMGFGDQSCVARRNPLKNGDEIALETKYHFVSDQNANGRSRSTVEQQLFRYDGAKAKVRLWVHMKGRLQTGPRVDIGSGTAVGHDQDLPSHILLRLPDGSELGLGNTIDNFGHRPGYGSPLSLMTAMSTRNMYGDPYDETRGDSLHIDFDLVPGDYRLVLYNECWVTEKRTKYSGWNSANQTLTFMDATLEMVF